MKDGKSDKIYFLLGGLWNYLFSVSFPKKESITDKSLNNYDWDTMNIFPIPLFFKLVFIISFIMLLMVIFKC